MAARASSFLFKVLSSAFGVAFVASLPLAAVAGCGRSNLNDYLGDDGGPDAYVEAGDAGDAGDGGACNATTCPSGCCDPVTHACAPGDTVTACGTMGEKCSDCQAEGYQLCDPTRRACGNMQTSCGPGNCSGCCEGTTCFAGTDPNECGGGGRACQHCQSAGLACSGQQCVQTACGPQNCKGCCFGNQCLSGTDQTACGQAGQQCQNCAASSETCVHGGGVGGTCQAQAQCNPSNCPGCCEGAVCVKGGSNTACGHGGQACQDCAAQSEICSASEQCVPPPPQCNSMTCPFGCCSGNVCLPGTMNGACGQGGAACQDCTIAGGSCQGQQCVNVPPACNASNCPGCCDANDTCQPGFVSSACGQSGASCQDCTQLVPPSTCDVSVTPRTCSSQQTQCPSPYPSCPASLQTPTPTQQNVCSAGDLQNAAAACAGGAHSTGCQSFFQFEQSQNPACATCLSAFDYDYQELEGLFSCVAPFVSASCDHDTACIVDCTDQSCAMCPAGSTAQCQQQVRSGQCSSYYQGASCVYPAFGGQGSFCNPNQYPNVGGWLAGVGKYYCAQ